MDPLALSSEQWMTWPPGVEGCFMHPFHSEFTSFSWENIEWIPSGGKGTKICRHAFGTHITDRIRVSHKVLLWVLNSSWSVICVELFWLWGTFVLKVFFFIVKIATMFQFQNCSTGECGAYHLWQLTCSRKIFLSINEIWPPLILSILNWSMSCPYTDSAEISVWYKDICTSAGLSCRVAHSEWHLLSQKSCL